MTNFQVAKNSLEQVQAVVTEALDNLDRLPPEEVVPKDTAIKAVHECAEGYENHIDNLPIEACCHILLKKYQGHEPSLGDVQTFKTTIELALHNDYGVSTSKFE